MSRGKLKKVFPGSNSAYGFFSFYDQIIEEDATRIYVIKGGPGVGKSTFMRNIGRELLRRGLDLEYHCCSADSTSLDGIVIPALKIACIDGTAPHVVDPKNPGAVDEIIHLGEFWNEAAVVTHREEILRANREKGRLYRRAYRYLAAAKLFLDEVEDYYRENDALDQAGLQQKTLEVIGAIFGNKTGCYDQQRRERHLFASAITPDGAVDYLETIIAGMSNLYIISGDDGTGKNELISRIKDAAVMRGFSVEAYHCALDPHRIDHVIIPALKTGIINSVPPHQMEPYGSDQIIETGAFVRHPGTRVAKERKIARTYFQQSFDTAISFLRRAREVHDELEAYYIPNMRFEEINDLSRTILEKILQYYRPH